MLAFNVIALQHVVREISKVERHDCLRVGTDCGGEHVTIIRVRQVQTLLQVLESSDKAIGNRIAHEAARSIKRASLQFHSLSGNVTEALVQYSLRPTRANNPCIRDPNQEIANWRRVEDASVVQDDESHPSIAEAVLLSLGREFIEHFPSTSLVAALVRQDIRRPDSPMSPYSAIGNDLVFQQGHEVRP